ncbi:hypothetical protein CV770_25210 [Bradyrhizobium sp. AC87j1]|nr:hypothetical protein CV770_25210 [Bradyrhizobium sp. AC87j1]
MRAAIKELGGSGRDEVLRALKAIADERLVWERSLQRSAVDTRKALAKIASAMHRVHLAHAKLPMEIRQELRLPDFEPYRAACNRIRREKRDRSGDYMKLVAAREARKLLVHFGFRVSATRLGQWDKLAAALYGDRRQRFAVQFKKLEKERKSAER